MYLKTARGRLVLVRTFHRTADGGANVVAGAGEVVRLTPHDAVRFEGRALALTFEPHEPVEPVVEDEETELPEGFPRPVAPNKEQ